MIPKTLLFVSTSLLQPPGDPDQLRAIVTAGRKRNETLSVSAALVAARGQFAQVLDGPEEAVAMLMASISSDPRHERVTVVLESEAPVLPPRPAGMDLVYHGESLYVSRCISPLLGPALAGEQPALASQLLFLIRELAKASRP